MRVRALLGDEQLEISDGCVPQVDRRALDALKFGDCLPPDLARKVVQARWADRRAARHALGPFARLSV